MSIQRSSSPSSGYHTDSENIPCSDGEPVSEMYACGIEEERHEKYDFEMDDNEIAARLSTKLSVKGHNGKQPWKAKDSGARTEDEDADDLELYRKVDFPGMKIPIRMRKQGKQLALGEKSEMESQSPMPGRVSTITTKDPVETVTWGPVTRIEASKQAQQVVRDLRKRELEKIKQERRNKKAKGKGRKESKSSEKTVTPKTASSTSSDVEEAMEAPIQEKHLKECQDPATGHAEEGTSADATASDTTAPSTPYLEPIQSWQSSSTFRFRPAFRLRAPPPTPPDTIFHQALSTPTLVELHRLSDPVLVEQYRIERAQDPVAFDARTAQIKANLTDAKTERGGIRHLLQNEYTVELASREDAERSEKWAERKSFAMRSRASTLSSYGNPEPCQLPMSLNANEQPGKASSSGGINFGRISTNLPYLPEGFPDLLDAKANAGPSKADTSHASTLHSKPTKSSKVKKCPDKFSIAQHFSKTTTSGSIRSQHTETRELSDTAETRTVTTWIEIIETYTVAEKGKLGWKDVCEAVETSEDEKNKKKKHAKASVPVKTKMVDHGDNRGSMDGNGEEQDGKTNAETLLAALATLTELDKKMKAGAISSLGSTAKAVLKEVVKLREAGELMHSVEQ